MSEINIEKKNEGYNENAVNQYSVKEDENKENEGEPVVEGEEGEKNEGEGEEQTSVKEDGNNNTLDKLIDKGNDLLKGINVHKSTNNIRGLSLKNVNNNSNNNSSKNSNTKMDSKKDINLVIGINQQGVNYINANKPIVKEMIDIKSINGTSISNDTNILEEIKRTLGGGKRKRKSQKKRLNKTKSKRNNKKSKRRLIK